MRRPATIVITSAGTLGDHLPYIALGRRLVERGHQVRLAVNPAMHPHVRAAGLQAVPCGHALDAARARSGAGEWDDLQADACTTAQWLQQARAHLAAELPQRLSDLLGACKGADLLVCGLQQQALAPLLSSRIGLNWVAASVMPAVHCSDRGWQVGKKSSRMAQIQQLVNQVLAPLQSNGTLNCDHGRIGALLGVSPQMCQVQPGHLHYEATGFWYEPVATNPAAETPVALQQFLQQYTEPLVLSFSSQPLLDAPGVLSRYVEAAQLLGRGLVVQRGWADFCEEMLPPPMRSEGVFFTDFIAQDVLFAQAGAVMHHGGIGTLARALRNGCPVLVEPYGNDQFFNAQRVLALGVGAAVHAKQVRADALAQVLAQRVLTPECRARARALGSLLQQEDGTALAADRIEAWLAYPKMLQRTDRHAAAGSCRCTRA